ncbi:hypothetical protein [Ensifer sp. SL37]|uniref:hypothetical protein n=1 Tax=Ensifer sp. SL37 TaxID=2995137 RepID=UPI002275FB8F|nr:hypothetical protein [Ensifer sp. SL37]MCY1744278.1 hypothetical protein [Ensifer sp. SL37]
MSPRRRRTQARFRIALRDNLQLHLFAEASPPAAIDNLKSFHSALSVLTSIRTVSAKSDNSYKATHLGRVPNKLDSIASIDEFNQFLQLDLLNQKLSVKTGQVGRFEREFFKRAFTSMFKNADRLKDFQPLWMAH